LQEESPQKLILATELHNIPNIQYSYNGTFLASCSISGRIVVYSGSPFKEIASLTHQNWMWSVNWISKSEIEELPLSSGQRAVSRDFFSENEQLEDYLLLCADANKFYLIEFTKSDNRDGYQMKIITEKKIGVPFMFRVSSNSLRFSISVKLEGAPIVVAALQHGSLIVVVHVCRYNGHYLLTHREVNLGYNSILVGMDAFVSSSQGGKFIEILALNVNPASIEFIKLKMTKTLQLAC
jgi:hypothetical protein